MSARNLPVNAQLTTLERREVRPPAFKKVGIVLAMDHTPVTSRAYRGY
jgi:hypothetical protein